MPQEPQRDKKASATFCRTPDNQMFMPTVFEDMIFGPMNYGMSREEAERSVDEILDELELGYLKHRQNHKISGGENAWPLSRRYLR